MIGKEFKNRTNKEIQNSCDIISGWMEGAGWWVDELGWIGMDWTAWGEWCFVVWMQEIQEKKQTPLGYELKNGGGIKERRYW